jgi:hypothetical protein
MKGNEMVSNEVQHGPPANGGINTENAAKPAADQQGSGKKRAKRISPKQLSAEIYGKKLALNPRLAQMKIGKASMGIPPSVIAYNQNRMNDAEKAMERINTEISGYRYDLKTRSHMEDGRRVCFTEHQAKLIKAKKVHAQANLIEATADYDWYRELVDDAVEAGKMRDLEFIKRSKEQASIKRTAPSIATKWIALVKTNGSLVLMKESALAGSQKDFRELFTEFVKNHESDDDKRIADKPKLFTRVMELVMANLIDEAKNDTSATPAEGATDQTSIV